MPVLPGMPVSTLRTSPGLMLRVDPGTWPAPARPRCRRDALERVVEVPMVDDVLVVPHDLAGVRVQRERRGVVEIASCRYRPSGTSASGRSPKCRSKPASAPDRSSAASTCRPAGASPKARRPRSRRPARRAWRSSKCAKAPCRCARRWPPSRSRPARCRARTLGRRSPCRQR